MSLTWPDRCLEACRRWLTRRRLWLRRKWTGVRVAVRRWRRRRKAVKNRNTPLREFIYLDEVSVYSLNASRLGAIAAEFTDTETRSLQSGSEVSVSSNVGAAKAGVKARDSFTETQQSQVVRRSIVQTTFREFYEHEKDHLVTRVVPEDARVPNIATLDDLNAKEEELKADGLIIDSSQLVRGALLEMEVELETEKIFQFNTIIKELVGIIQENTAIFGIDEQEFDDAKAYGRIIEQLLAGLVPIRGRAVDYVRMVVGGRELIVHRKLSEPLLTRGLSSNARLESSPLYVVGVTEEALHWKDIRRVLFSGTRFYVLCRLAQDGVQNSWTPIKLRDVLAKMPFDLAENMDRLASGNFFGRTSDKGNGIDHKKQKAFRLALYCYTASLAAEYKRNLVADDILLDVESIVERYQDAFKTTSGMKEGFNAIAECLTSNVGIELDSSAEKERRLEALGKAGLSLMGDLVSMTEPAGDTPFRPDKEDHVLDSEFIAIYW